jgi:hypothetical protein
MTFFLGVFLFAPKELPEFKQRMLAFSSAILAALFGFFFTGQIDVEWKFIKQKFGDLGVKATGGAGLFVLVLAWWLSPLAPVKASLALKPIQFSPEANQISVLSKDVDKILYSFDEKSWKEAVGVVSRETGFEGVEFTTGRLETGGITGRGKVYIKYMTRAGEESTVKQFSFNPEGLGSLGRPVSISEIVRSNLGGKDVTEEEFKRLRDQNSTRELILTGARFHEDVFGVN